MLNYKVIDCHNIDDKVIKEALKYDRVAINPDYRIEKYRIEAHEEFMTKMAEHGYKLAMIDKDGWRLIYVLEKTSKEEDVQN